MEYIKCEKEMRLKACNKHTLRQNLKNSNLGRSRRLEEVVDLIEDGQSVRELELIQVVDTDRTTFKLISHAKQLQFLARHFNKMITDYETKGFFLYISKMQ